ncbi:MAG: DUF2160 domain-containing protein [Pseudomonadota bacterium]
MSWMAWTWPTGAFFICIGLALLIMTIWELYKPTRLVRGFLPMATTRGDRFFISLLSAAFIHLAWLGLIGVWLWVASILAILWGIVLLRWG